MPGMSSLPTNLSVDSTENEKEPPVEITAVGLMPTNSLLPKSTKATKKGMHSISLKERLSRAASNRIILKYSNLILFICYFLISANYQDNHSYIFEIHYHIFTPITDTFF